MYSVSYYILKTVFAQFSYASIRIWAALFYLLGCHFDYLIKFTNLYLIAWIHIKKYVYILIKCLKIHNIYFVSCEIPLKRMRYEKVISLIFLPFVKCQFQTHYLGAFVVRILYITEKMYLKNNILYLSYIQTFM